MKVAVVGGGIVGITSAWELAADGHDVTVFERRGSVAAEASFAHAGLVAPGRLTPWSAPGTARQVLGQLVGRHASVRLHGTPRPAELAWLWRWWRAGRARTAAAQRLRLHRLAAFSRQRLAALSGALKLDYERGDGCLVLLRTARDAEQARPGLAALAELGSRFESLDPAGCRAVEPGLGDETPLHGGVFLPDDEVGNCRQFALLLRTEAQQAGVRFRFHTEVQRIVAGAAPQLVHLHVPPDEASVLVSAESGPADAGDTVPMPLQAVTEGFDAVVVCNALASAALLRPHGVKLPMQAVHGYSVTAPLRRIDPHGEIGPRAAVIDERCQVAISRFGARVRVSGGVELGGAPNRHHADAVQALYRVLHDWFPGCARLGQAQVWKGARAMLPDGPPVLGPSGLRGVWLNLGHGGAGWALACGSARLVADAVAGRPASIDIEGLGLARLEA